LLLNQFHKQRVHALKFIGQFAVCGLVAKEMPSEQLSSSFLFAVVPRISQQINPLSNWTGTQ
jgi:hypothetical protein